MKSFKVTKITPIPELNCVLKELIHEPTGAQVVHIENDDPENLFCLSFQTIPKTSNGVAHILEHTVLCGSKKFPIKDPFFAMNRRSLNTFMNALTGADFTCYPAATQVEKDFYNLLEVYLDAVFHPKLEHFSFLQEGIRLELTQPDDLNSPLQYKGIVFNEMKGALSSASARMHELMYHELFPAITYGINSGGDPKVIPQLTYEELKEFHHLHYHPSHCLFFFYGNMPLDKHLTFIEEHALKGVKPLPPIPPIGKQPRFSSPKRLVKPYPIAEMEEEKGKALHSFGWITTSIDNILDLTALQMLEIVLMENDGSYLKKALLKSGLCKQAGIYLDNEMTECPLVIILRGCEAGDADKIEKLIFETIGKFVDEGIAAHAIENAIHQQAFHRLEITHDHGPFGLNLFMRSVLLKQHGIDPLEGLKVQSLFQTLREKIKNDPHYLTGLLQKYILSNPHMVRLTLVPDKALQKEEQEAEQKELQKIQEKLSLDERKQLVETAKKLEDFQKSQEEQDIDVLPKVELNDIPEIGKRFSLKTFKQGHLNIYHHACFTNSIVYADLVWHLPAFKEEDLPYLRLLTILLTQLGAGPRSYEENLEFIQAHTGGIGSAIALNLQAGNQNLFYPTLHLKGKALDAKTPELFTLLKDTVDNPHFKDRERIREILHKHYTALEASLNQNSLRYALFLTNASLAVPAAISNIWYGLPHYHFVKDLVTHFDDKMFDKLLEIETRIFNSSPDFVISSDEKSLQKLLDNHLYGFPDHHLSVPKGTWNHIPLPQIKPQGRTVASPVAFIARAFNTIPYTHEDAPALSLAAHLFDNVTLHAQIREQGGAYGGGSSSSSLAGSFYFYSYRDPHIASTFKAFQDAVDTIVKGDFDEGDLEEAKLELIQGLDSPISPGSRADLAYGWLLEGKTDSIRQAFRERALKTTHAEIQKAVQKHIQAALNTGIPVVFASEELLAKENALLKEPLTILPI